LYSPFDTQRADRFGPTIWLDPTLELAL